MRSGARQAEWLDTEGSTFLHKKLDVGLPCKKTQGGLEWALLMAVASEWVSISVVRKAIMESFTEQV